MSKTGKIYNLYRLNYKNRITICIYWYKRILKINTTANENYLYAYYNYLINFNGCFVEENANYIVTDFKRRFKTRIKLRKLPSSDLDVFHQIFYWGEYLPVIETFKSNFSTSLGKKINILDAGGNIGLTSLFFLEHFSNANIICVEPEIGNFKVLDYNLSNKQFDNVKKINAAIWSHNSKIRVVNDFRDQLDWSFRVEETESMDFIEAYSINQIATNYGLKFIDILKIDIEGSEKEIFTFSNNNLGFLNITKCIAMEIHDEFKCRKEIYEVLTHYGFLFFNQGELTIGYNQNLLSSLRL
jgi:FkbM family methyltransferase